MATVLVPETTPESRKFLSLEDFLSHPPENMEWVDGKFIEKKNLTLRHAQIQSRLDYYWRNYMLSSDRGGEVYTEALCLTNKQGLPRLSSACLQSLHTSWCYQLCIY